MSRFTLPFIIVLFFGLAGCTTQIEGVEFSVPGRPAIPLYHPGNPIFGIDENLFLLEHPVAVIPGEQIYVDLENIDEAASGSDSAGASQRDGETFVVQTFSSAMVENRQYDIPLSTHAILIPTLARGDRRSIRAVFVPFEENGEYPIGGVDIGGFRIAAGSIDVLGSGLISYEDGVTGIRLDRERITLSERYSYNEMVTVEPASEVVTRTIGVGLAGSADFLARGPGVRIEYRYDPEPQRMIFDPDFQSTAPSMRVRLSGSSESGSEPREYEVLLQPGNGRITVPSEFIGFTPGSLQIQVSEPGFVLSSIVYSDPVSPAAPWNAQIPVAARIPIALPADMGTVLGYPQGAWRQVDFELFSWEIHPAVYVLDFRNRTVQAAFFKRLAFFVEKKNFRGTLLTNEELAGRHGYNAHNYRGQGLSDFFNAVEAAAFPLNPEEEYLRELTASLGLIIRNSDGTWGPGPGGIISITRDPQETVASRTLLLSHETTHGIYYMNTDLVLQTRAEWQNISSTAREYFMRYLSYSQYDISDIYLLENEYQAYMLQQRLDDIPYVFGILYRDRMARTYPNDAEFFITNAGDVVSEYYDSAFRLQALLFRRYGFLGGNIIAVREIID